MNKIEIIDAIAKEAGVSKSESERILNGLISVIVSEVKKGNKVAIAGFGNFEKIKRAARVGVNPSTGQKINIAAKNAPKFKAAKAFKDAVA